MAKTLRRYRLKLTLADGRKVYTVLNGKPDTKPASAIRDVRQEALQMFAYSPDLLLFGPVSEFAKRGIKPVKVVSGEFEMASQPLDPEAFIPGGTDGQ